MLLKIADIVLLMLVSVVGFSVGRESFPLFGCTKVGASKKYTPPPPLLPNFCCRSTFRAENPTETLATQAILIRPLYLVPRVSVIMGFVCATHELNGPTS